MNFISPELLNSLSDMFSAISKALDITKTQYDNLTKSYTAVGKYLEEDPIFKPYNPIVSPQGSFRLGTIIQPISDKDDLDIDLVYRLIGKKEDWTQSIIKNLVGLRLKSHAVYNKMLDEEGRRCWTLLYRQDSNEHIEHYHMDILPCVAEIGYSERIKKMMSSCFSPSEVDKIAIRITDNKTKEYHTSYNIFEWMKSNPDGYAIWFASRCKASTDMREATVSNIMPLGTYISNKSVLQRIVQILKRHRDIMFQGDDDKPISIIITTLAAQAYQGEANLFEGLCNVIDRMELYIKKENGILIIENPVNSEENFADKWTTYPERKEKFFKWLEKLKKDKSSFINDKGAILRESFANTFGKSFMDRIFANRIIVHKEKATNGKLKVSSTGVIGTIGKTLNAKNTFYGKK